MNIKITQQTWSSSEDRNNNKPKEKITLEELRKNSIFAEHVGCLEGVFPPEMTSVEIAKHWTDYVD